MEWLKIYSKLAVHRKWLRLSPGQTNDPKALWVDCLLWVGLDESEGFIPADIASGKGTDHAINRLIEVGLWDEVAGGYQFHDFDIAQPDVVKRRALDRVRQQRKRESRVTPRRVTQTDKKRIEKNREEGDIYPLFNSSTEPGPDKLGDLIRGASSSSSVSA